MLQNVFHLFSLSLPQVITLWDKSLKTSKLLHRLWWSMHTWRRKIIEKLKNSLHIIRSFPLLLFQKYSFNKKKNVWEEENFYTGCGKCRENKEAVQKKREKACARERTRYGTFCVCIRKQEIGSTEYHCCVLSECMK